MRKLHICVIALAIAVILIAQPVAALPILQVPYYRAGSAWFLKPQQAADLFILETNVSHLATSDTEAFALSFQPALTGSAGMFIFAPVIAQTSSQAIACDQTYLFQDFSGVA
ncbi:MAG: hypothetical protein WBZ29_13490 [Methanocella sp.]